MELLLSKVRSQRLVSRGLDLVVDFTPDVLFELGFVQIFNVRLDELQSVGLLTGTAHFEVGRILLAVLDVLLDGLIEQDGLLHHVADLVAQLLDVVVVDGVPVDQNLALLLVVEAEQQRCDSGLSTS